MSRADAEDSSREAERRETPDLRPKQADMASARAAAEAMRRRLEGRPHRDSGETLAEERAHGPSQ